MAARAREQPSSRAALPADARCLARIEAVRLAFGLSASAEHAARRWEDVFDHAIRERCASLAWLRSSALILASAPRAVSARWRAHALGAGELAAAQADELVTVVGSLKAEGLNPIVLKGQPLSVLLYGTAAARPIFDVDLFVPLANRPAAHRVMLRSGWRHLDGNAPAEGTYQRSGGARSPHLEIHSSLFDDGLLAHLAVPDPESAEIEVEEHRVYAHVGNFLPLFLAVHLAKHSAVPLLWWLDFATLWNGLVARDQAAVRATAAKFRLVRFLDWAAHGATLVSRVSTKPVAEAARALDTLDALHSSRNASRVRHLMQGPRAKFGVALGWAVPPRYRSAPWTFLVTSLRRARARVARVMRRKPRSEEPLSGVVSRERTLPVAPAEAASLVRHTTALGGTVWITVRGTSMLPTIPRKAEVLIGPLPLAGIGRGDVVLVERAGSRLLMHRVVGVSGDTVHLKGDNRFERDLPVRRREIIGSALQIRVGERPGPIPGPPRYVRFALARWRTYLRRSRSSG